MNELSRQLDINYTIEISEDSKYGILRNDSWDGMVKQLIEGVIT
jgi:hypothetical protein